MINFLIADDHAFLRRGLRQALQEEFLSAKIIETETGRATIEAVKTHQFDLVVLDINFPDINGIDVLKEIRLVNQSVPVIIFTLYPEEHYALRAFDAGASGYVTKDSGPDEFISAVTKVLDGNAEAR
ncbi:MAG: response regulator transcription factor [Gammaproteobacteria bacterium]|nr:response regulator transcription factor [Gammaproteobacteria bacterium]